MLLVPGNMKATGRMGLRRLKPGVVHRVPTLRRARRLQNAPVSCPGPLTIVPVHDDIAVQDRSIFTPPLEYVIPLGIFLQTSHTQENPACGDCTNSIQRHVLVQ